MKSLRVGIVGCGRMGKERARSCAQSGAALVVVCDADLNRAEEMAGQHPGCRPVRSEEEVPYQALDAIFVCTPPGQRRNVELAAIGAGLPFFSEKPIAISAAAALPIREALSRKAVIHAVGYMNRYRASVQHARRVIKERRLLGIAAYWVGRKYEVPWWLDQHASGGPVNEQATHMLDICRYLVGEVAQIECLASTGTEMFQRAATLLFCNGCLGTIFYSCEARDKQIAIRLIGAEGGLDLSGWDLHISSNTIDGTIPNDQCEDIFLKETRRFLESVKTGDPNLIECNFEDAFKTQLLMDSMLGIPLPELAGNETSNN